MSKEEQYLLDFGSNLYSLRRAQNMSYREMAQRCNIDFSDISKIEKGKVNIQLTTVLELSKALNIKPSELFTF